MGERMVFDGIELSDSSDMAALLRRQLSSGVLSGKTTDQGPEEAIWRLFRSIEGTHFEQVFEDALMQLLTDSDVAIRTAAVGLAQDFAENIDPGRLLGLLDADPALFNNVEPRGPARSDFQGRDLGWGLLRAIAGHPTSDDKVLSRLRAAAMDVKNGARVLAGLTVSDPGWVLRNLKELIDQEPWRASIVLNNLDDPAQRKDFAQAANQSSPRGRAAAVKAVNETIKDSGERTLLLSLLGTTKSPAG
jgi:hypothetical protein